MSLLEDAIWWHVYPLGACGAPIRQSDHLGGPVEHRLARLEPWLDHAIKLGCSGILLAPIFSSVSHGYDTVDYYRIDPRLGDDADFDALVSACHERGLSLILDGVFNHVAREHPLAEKLGARRADGSLAPWEGHPELVTLNHGAPAVVDLVTDVMLHWLRRGIAGWRLDVAYAVPTEFWREVCGRVRKEFPGALFLGEVIHGDYAQFVRDSSLDTVTQYELWKSISSSIENRNFWELAWTLGRQEELCAGFIPQTFIGNHDVARVASVIGDAGAVLAAVMLLTLPGMPSIYYGDERGFRGKKLEGFSADDELRPPLPASAGELVGGEWLYRIYQELIGLRRRNRWIAGGSVEVVAKDNEWIEYSVRPGALSSKDTYAGGEELRVRVELEPVPAARVTDGSGAWVFAWPAPASPL